MTPRQIGSALIVVIVAVILQTTLFARLRPLDVPPDVVILAIIGCARWLEPEPGVLLGFTGGLFIDLFGSAPLGLQALAFTLVALVAVRTRDRYAYNVLGVGVAVGLLTFLGIALVAILGTLFGQGTLGDPDILKTLVLVPVYNVGLAIIVLPIIGAVMGETRPEEASLL